MWCAVGHWNDGDIDILEPLPAATPDPAVTRDAAQTLAVSAVEQYEEMIRAAGEVLRDRTTERDALAEVVRLKDERIRELQRALQTSVDACVRWEIEAASRAVDARRGT
jgi:hypothetical protein